MDPAPRDLDAPAQHVAIGVVEVAERAPGQRVAFDVVDPALLDLPFVLGCPGPTGRDEEAVVLGALAVAPLDFWIVEGGADDRGAEIVEDDPMGHPAEEFERDPVESHPRVHRLVEHELGVLMPAARQCHHEDPGPADAVALGIQELAAEAEVYLRLVARVDLHAQRGPDLRGGQPAQEALDRGVAAGEVVLLGEELPDRLAFDAAVVQGFHALPKRLDQRLLLGRALGGRWPEQRGQGGRLRQGRVEQPLVLSPLPVPGDGVAAHGEVAGDAPVRFTQLQSSQDLANVGHQTPPSRHPHTSVSRKLTPAHGQRGLGWRARSPVTSRRVAPHGRPWVAPYG